MAIVGRRAVTFISVRLQRKIVGEKKSRISFDMSVGLSVCLCDAYTTVIHPTNPTSMFSSGAL